MSSDSPFETRSSTTITKQDRYKELFQEWVFAPLLIIWDDYRTRFGGAIVATYLLMGTVGVMIVEKPRTNQGPSFHPPFQSMEFPLGTGLLGQDILAQVIHATPAMLQMIFAGAIFSTAVATAVGTLTGYKGGLVDDVLMLITDIVMTIPGLPLTIVVAVILEPRNPYLVGIILTINAWAGLARAIRSQVLTIRESSYIEASRTLGLSTHSILTKDVLPNLMPYIMVHFVTAARNVIISSVGLYFLGILPFTTLNWGVMMNMAYEAGAMYTSTKFHWFIIPMAVVVLLSYGLILFGQGTDRVFNPRIRARHASDEEAPSRPAE